MVPQSISVNEWWFVGLVAVIFAFLGMRRGLTIELYMLGAVLLGIVLADPIARFLEPWINIIWQAIQAVVRDRAFSPDKLVATMFSQPKLLTTPLQLKYLGSIVFVAMVILAWLIGRKRAAKGKGPRFATRLLAGIVGAVNGYLIAYFLFPRHISTTATVVRLSSVDIRSLLQIRLFVPILLVILVIITIGVLGSREGARGKK